MYCGQCGKKVMENMLFCPFCGSPIVIPDQDVPPQRNAEEADSGYRQTEIGSAAEQDGPVSLYDDAASQASSIKTLSDGRMEQTVQGKKQDDGEEFVPLRFSFDEPFDSEEPFAESQPLKLGRVIDAEEKSTASSARQDAQSVSGHDPCRTPFQAAYEDGEAVLTDPVPAPAEVVDVPEEVVQPARRQESGPQLENIRRRVANTYIPVKQVDINDIFMDGDEDDYDLDEDADGYDLDDYDLDDELDEDFGDGDYDFEEREEGSFMRRHMRGMVGLILFLLLAVICMFWASTDKGQLTLARFNLAWRAEPYAELGYEAYLADNALLAARYYERALARNGQNYEYAHSAMVAYYEADDVEAAAGMLKKCIAMQPDNAEPYREMLILYPDPDTRPWEIKELIRTGYQRTGDEALKDQ